nr:vWA domain-containing protein [Halorientalis salina]
MALLGAVLVVVFGSGLIDQVQNDNNEQTAQLVIQEVDSRFSTLAQMNDVSRVDFTIGDTDSDEMRTVRQGELSVMVNRNSSCRSTAPLSSLRYESAAGETVAYEAGGVWRQSAENASTMVTAPDVNFRNGTLSATVVNISGNIRESYNTARLETETSRTQSQELTGQILHGSCIRPDNMTVKVTSDFYKAWGDYLETEFGVESQTWNHNNTSLVHLPQSELPPETNDEINTVVNLARNKSGDPEADYMEDVDIGETDPQNISINKNTTKDEYIVTVRPLSERNPQVGKIKEIVDTTTVYREPFDVVFIMDVSGSMSWDPNSDGNTKSEDAQVGATSFVSELNGSFDRAGVVTYENYPAIKQTDDGRYLTSEKGGTFSTSGCWAMTGINNTICEIDNDPGGGTRIWRGIEQGHELFDLTSNQTRTKIAVLLTDGLNNACDNSPPIQPNCDNQNARTVDTAKAADKSDITIYTIGYGDEDDIADGVLKDVASETGGQFNQTEDADELKAIFEDIAEKEKETKLIARQPLSTNVSGGSEVHSPFIPGDTDDIATHNTSSGTFMNVNDPTAPSQFRHRFALEGGESVEINATWYGCADNHWQTTPYSGGGSNQSYNIARCTKLDTSGVNHLDEDDVSLYTDGEDISAELTNSSAWWQTNMTNTLVDAGALDNKSDTTLNLSSNQAVAIMNFSISGAPFDNRMALLYEVGLSESQANPEDIINFRIRNVELN